MVWHPCSLKEEKRCEENRLIFSYLEDMCLFKRFNKYHACKENRLLKLAIDPVTASNAPDQENIGDHLSGKPVGPNEDLASVIEQVLSQLVLSSQIHRIIF